jgi:hypothetical protein
MVVLANGCSFSRGPGSWPYALQSIYNFNLVNLAQSGAGNTYIFESTVLEISQRVYDLVLIMWSDPNRIDYRFDIDNSHPGIQAHRAWAEELKKHITTKCIDMQN